MFIQLGFSIVCSVLISSPRPFPPCNQPLYETVLVKLGDNATFSASFTDSYILWDEVFAWTNGGEKEMWNSSFHVRNCDEKPKHNFRMGFDIRRDFCHYRRREYLIFEMTVFDVNYDDSMVYFLQTNFPSCTVTMLQVNVIVRNSLPLCSAFLAQGNSHQLTLSCFWMPQKFDDKMKLMSGNRTLQLYENSKLAAGSTISWNVATYISLLINLGDIFDNYRVPDTCQVYDSEIEIENRCEFPLFMSPKTNEINDDGGEVFFTCCTNSDTFPSVWWQTRQTNLVPINTSGQWITIDMDSEAHGKRKTTVILVCGQIQNNDVILFGIGKIDLTLEYHGRISLFGNIEQENTFTASPQGETKCTGLFNITVAGYPIVNEQKNHGKSLPPTLQ